MMKRHVFLAIGMLASILGLTSLVDTAFADGCRCNGCSEPCPNASASSDTQSCNSSLTTFCDDQGQAACTNPNTQFYELAQDFPKSCVQTANSNTKCNSPSRQCWRKTTCTYNAQGKCVPASDDDNPNPWQSLARNETSPC